MMTYTISTRIAKYKIPIGMLALECDYCHSLIGIFNPENVSVPIKGSMFESLLKERGVPPPFLGSSGREAEDSWKYCTCKACGNNCFYDRKTNKCKTELLTPLGKWEIGSSNIPRKITQADINQAKIEEMFEEEDLPFEDKNQKEIEATFEEVKPVDAHCRYCDKYYSSAHWLEKHEEKCKGEKT